MPFTLGPKSRANLQGVHPKLVQIVERAIALTTQDFTVQEGLRTVATQRLYVQRGVSKTMNSMHIQQPDGFGHAVDLVPWIGNMPRWEWKPIFALMAAVHQATKELNIPLIWGGVWDRAFLDLTGTAAGLEQAVNAYVARRRGMGKTAFIDGPHVQLA